MTIGSYRRYSGNILSEGFRFILENGRGFVVEIQMVGMQGADPIDKRPKEKPIVVKEDPCCTE